MLKKTITYETFDGETVTEDFYFHLSKADLVEMEMSKKGGLEAWLKRIVASQDGRAIMEEFKNLILRSVGQKSEDGRRFDKSIDIRNDFASSPAYDVLFMELLTDAEKAAAFVNGLLPKGMDAELSKVPQPSNTLAGKIEGARAEEAVHNVFEQAREITRAEAIEMDGTELSKGLADGTLRIAQ